jgi:carboxymethylenebutenolidase
MKTQNITVKLRDGEMGAHLAIPDRTPAGAIIAIMEIWGVNDTMRHHAHEFAQAGFICLVPDLFWRQEPGVELSDGDPEHIKKAFDLYCDFDYDLAVRDMEDSWNVGWRRTRLSPSTNIRKRTTPLRGLAVEPIASRKPTARFR